MALHGYISGVFTLPGFRQDYISVDFMHTGDLGATQYILGSVFFTLFLQLGGLLTQPGRVCGRLLVLVKMFSKHLKVQAPINALYLTMFKRQGKPAKFKGKASTCRYLVPIIFEILKFAAPAKSYEDRLRFACVQQLVTLYSSIMARDQALFKVAQDACRRMLILYCELNHFYAEQRGDFAVLRIVPKLHMLIHCIDQMVVCGVVTSSWCYADESSIGNAVKIARKGHPSTVSKSVMDKYRTWDIFSMGE